MIDIERRLQHAARELRELQIEPPPLPSLGARPRPNGVAARLPALVMPVLFVLGGLAVVAGGLDRQGDVPDAAPAVEVSVAADVATVPGTDDAAVATAPALTARQEIALISSLQSVSVRQADDQVSPASVGDALTLAQRYR